MTAAFNVEWMWGLSLYLHLFVTMYMKCVCISTDIVSFLRFTKYRLFFICIRIGTKIGLVWIVFVTILCVCDSTCICIKTYIFCIFACICILGGWFHCMLHHLGWQAPWICIDCEGCILLPRVSQNYICFPQQRTQQAESFLFTSFEFWVEPWC